MTSKYGLQLRIRPQNRPPVAPPVIVNAPGFGNNDDDEDENDVNQAIERQQLKTRAHREIEEQQKKALEEDPTVFDYDGVYDQMKIEAVQPLKIDKQERKSKYIERLMEKAKQREREHEIVYERKLAKERSKDEHLFADKDKYVTSAYKKKLAEQAKWLEEERRRELREEREDVTKKTDISEFYLNLSKNVAFGAKAAESSREVKHEDKVNSVVISEKDQVLPSIKSPSNSDEAKLKDQAEGSPNTEIKNDSIDVKTKVITSLQENVADEQKPADKKELDHHKRKEDALAAAKERYLSRKKGKMI
ncbi:Nuclear speckle splicing regulatory protein [Thalictrum thalictroides]|uniref:Nuclear speckle splicing regulatory protein n=1 Tax=Thalictrum thalictroides TaxID=46969 RepID=A0A7J6VF97_THATH|nr:Nuclear speckle splicing regulatory protein [Thalictrum thalictroides]